MDTKNTTSLLYELKNLLPNLIGSQGDEFNSVKQKINTIISQLAGIPEDSISSDTKFYSELLDKINLLFKYQGPEFSTGVKKIIQDLKSNYKTVNYSGETMRVVSEDEDSYTIQGINELKGVKLRVTKEEVLLNSPEEDKLLDEAEFENPDFTQPPEDVLPSTKPEGNDLMVKEESTDNPSYPNVGIDVSVLGTKERHAENEKRIKDSLISFRENLKKMLEELNSLDSTDNQEEVVTEDQNTSTDYNGAKITPQPGISGLTGEATTTFSITWPDGKIEPGYDSVDAAKKKIDYFMSKYPDYFTKKLEEDDGGSCGGTSTSGVATFASRVGIGLQTPERRKETYKNV
jgi:hypothetical protein